MLVLAPNTVTVGSQTEKRNTNATFIQEMSIDLHNKKYKAIYYVQFCSHNMKHFSTVSYICMHKLLTTSKQKMYKITNVVY
jgi:hypothetical protein